MPVSKTRSLFIDVARNLFATIGFDATTMNTIAAAAKKGRRTLYTYFKGKEDIFSAIIEEELQTLYKQLKTFIETPLPPEDKLMKFVYLRLEAIRQVVKRNGSLNAEFFCNAALVERARLKFDKQESLLIQRILKEGIQAGVFKIYEIKFTSLVIHSALKGMEVPYIRGQLGRTREDQSKRYRIVKQIILSGVGK